MVISSSWLIMQAYQLGFDFVAVGPAPQFYHTESFKHWLDQSMAGDMKWMSRSGNTRLCPQSRWPDLKSVIATAFVYGLEPSPIIDRTHALTISCYAWTRDYHRVIGKRLKRLAIWAKRRYPEFWFQPYVDTGPVPEKIMAAVAGLGWIGKHGNLIRHRDGSWFFLGVILTNAELTPVPGHQHPDRCGRCTRCIDICPTGAIIAPGVVDARRCISYWTIEHEGPIPEAIRPLLGTKIFGCDDCQTICPWNTKARKARDLHVAVRYRFSDRVLYRIVYEGPEAFQRAFAGSPVMRLGYRRFLRNVLIALVNARRYDCVDLIQHCLKVTTDSMLKELVEWALDELKHDKQTLVSNSSMTSSGTTHDDPMEKPDHVVDSV